MSCLLASAARQHQWLADGYMRLRLGHVHCVQASGLSSRTNAFVPRSCACLCAAPSLCSAPTCTNPSHAPSPMSEVREPVCLRLAPMSCRAPCMSLCAHRALVSAPIRCTTPMPNTPCPHVLLCASTVSIPCAPCSCPQPSAHVHASNPPIPEGL